MTVAIPLLESMAETSGKSSADRYIGSLISLTSTSGFRYEGILYMVDAENSNIALQNVCSFGTEGRKKDGREIPASDKVYEFIVFRGTDIKDLEVKSSPPARPDNGSEIISEQPQHTQHAAASLVSEAPITVLAVGTRPVSSAGLEPSSLEGSTLRLSQSATSSSLWGPSPPPLGASDTISPLHSQKLFRSSSSHLSERLIPPFYPFHPFSPQPFEVGHQWITAPLSTIPVDTPKEVNSKATSEITLAALGLHTSTSDPEIAFISNPGKPHPLPCSSSTVSSVSLSTKVHPFPSNSKSGTHKPPGKIAQKTTTQVKSHILPPFLGRTMDMVTAAPLSPQAMAPVTINASSFQVHQAQSGTEHAYTVDPVSGKSLTPIHRSQQDKEETKFSKAASRVPQSQQPKQQFSTSQPLLPLPLLPAEHKPAVQRNGSSRPKWQGRITGNVSAFRAVKPWHQFMEDFDFTTMNQLFNKEEIWSELGKDAAKEKDGNSGNQCLIMKDAEGSMSSELSNKSTCHLYMKHAYVKDEFFDDLSCNSGEEKVERVKFSERQKLDVETFGSCASRSHGGMRGKHATLYRNGGSARRERGGRTVNKYRPQNCGSKGHQAAS